MSSPADHFGNNAVRLVKRKVRRLNNEEQHAPAHDSLQGEKVNRTLLLSKIS